MATLFFLVVLATGTSYTITPSVSMMACQEGARAMLAVYAKMTGIIGYGWSCVPTISVSPPPEKERES